MPITAQQVRTITRSVMEAPIQMKRFIGIMPQGCPHTGTAPLLWRCCSPQCKPVRVHIGSNMGQLKGLVGESGHGLELYTKLSHLCISGTNHTRICSLNLLTTPQQTLNTPPWAPLRLCRDKKKKAPHSKKKKKLALNSSLKAGYKQQETRYEKQLSSPSKHGLIEKLS